MKVVFSISVGIIVYVYFGYLLLLVILSRFIKNSVKKGNIEPSVSMIISAYNEGKSIRKKLENTLNLDYPKEKTEIIVASNGSTDKTDEIVSEYSKFGVKLNSIKEQGKTNAQNKTVPLTSGEIILFSDANSIYSRDAIKQITRNFADKKVGLVHGQAIMKQDATSSIVTTGVTSYLKYENLIKTLESYLGRCVVAYGGMIAIRKDIFEPIDVNSMEDFMLPIMTVVKGYKSIFEREAIFIEKGAFNPKDEFKIRSRIIAQDSRAFFKLLFRLVFSRRWFLLFQLISHKFLRWHIPIFLLLIFIISISLINVLFYRLIFYIQLAFYILSVFGYLLHLQGKKARLLYLPFHFCALNFSAFIGIFKMYIGKKLPFWDKIESTRSN
jgi:cellulose synthase/poly-beta-1,6-N-acetylglucosamine synthase-like glycosyltransferase